MIWITPLDASVPYRVAAAGPLITSMLSMSSGLMSFRRLTGAFEDNPVSGVAVDPHPVHVDQRVVREGQARYAAYPDGCTHSADPARQAPEGDTGSSGPQELLDGEARRPPP